MLARRWTENEVDDFVYQWGYIPAQLTVGADAIAVVVHPDNPIRDLLLADVDGAFSSTRRRGGRAVRTWGDLGLDGAWQSKPLRAFAMAAGTFGRAQFQTLALQGGKLREDVRELADSSAVVNAVADNPDAIAFVPAAARSSAVRAVPLRAAGGAASVELQAESAVGMSYPLAWRIYVNVHKEKGRALPGELAELLSLIYSREGQEVLVKEGFLPVTGRFARKELAKVK
jgi:phosphate transport system substrate-binding protein